MKPFAPKPGPVPHGYVDIHIDLPRPLRDWAKRQPEGVLALARRRRAAAPRRRARRRTDAPALDTARGAGHAPAGSL
jgi:hypothetical protein